MRILDMLRLLEEYRRKCIEVDDDYIEAKRAEDKFEKTLAKATKKQKEQIRTFQEKELRSIELTQQQQYKEFSDAWDEYMADYEATAYLSLEVRQVFSLFLLEIKRKTNEGISGVSRKMKRRD